MPTLSRLWNVFRRSRTDDELRQEIETHLALIEDEERARGSSPEQARRDARSRFGNPVSYRERAVEATMAVSLESAVKELGFAARRLTRSPTFSLATVVTLALAIGANASIFAVVERVVLNPLPYPDSDRLIVLDHGSERFNMRDGWGITRGLYYQYAERSRTLEGLAIYQFDGATLTGAGGPERVRVARVTPSLASVLRVSPALGRWFSDSEGVPGAEQVAVLSYGLWMRRFSRDPGVTGRSVLLGGVRTRIVGVMPQTFAFPDARVDMWTVAQMARAQGFGLWSYNGIARLRDGATVNDVRTELPGLIADVPRAFPGDLGALGNVETNLVVTATVLKEKIVGGVAKGLWILLAAVGLVLLVACANVTNLLLVRSEVRAREVAIRRALGAGRIGITRFFLAESLLLSLSGGALGVGVAWVAVRLLVRLGPASLPRLTEIHLDAVSVAYGMILSLLVAIVFGVIPTWRGGTISLSESGRANTASRTRYRTRQLLMGGQVSLSLVLLIASALMVRSFQNTRAVDPGFDASSALTFTIGLPGHDYPTKDAAVTAHQSILDGLAAMPGVRNASASTCLPLSGGCFGNSVLIRGRVDLRPGVQQEIALFDAVADKYFETMGIRIIRGRAIDHDDIERRRPVIVVDQTLARRFFPNQDAIGQYLASNRPPRRPGEPPRFDWLEIVGISVPTPIYTMIDPHPLPHFYMPMSISAGADTASTSLVGPDISTMSYVVRSSVQALSTTPPGGLLPAVRRVVDTVDGKLALAQVQPLQTIVDRSSAQMAFTMVLLAIAAAVALVLGVVGIYGVMSYLVTLRTGEIGVRIALGAEPRSVSGMIVRQGGRVAVVGVVIGLGVALTGARMIDSLLYGVDARDPAIFAATAVALLGVALMACWVPARRAASLNPIEALRS